MLILRVFGLIHQREVTKKDGSKFEIRFQEAETIQENRRPRVVEISVHGDYQYKEGLHTLSAQSFRPDKYERLEMAFPTLTPPGKALKIAEQANEALKSRKST